MIDLNFVNSLKKDNVKAIYKAENEDIYLIVGLFPADKSERERGFGIPSYARAIFLTAGEFGKLTSDEKFTSYGFRKLYDKEESARLRSVIRSGSSPQKPDSNLSRYSQSLLKRKINSELMQISLADIVKQDIKAFKVLYLEKMYNHAAFFLCQAIEKTMKSILTELGPVPKIHSIKALVELYFEKTEQEKDRSILNIAQKCDKVYLLSRYPPVNYAEKTGKTAQIEESDIRECLRLMIFIRNIVLSKRS